MGYGQQFMDLPAIAPPIVSGSAANKPPASYRNANALYVATDTGAVWFSTGAAWVAISGGSGGVPSIDGITSAVTLVAGSGVTITDNSPSAGDITISATGGSGTVTSVGLALPSQFTVSGSPVTSSGLLTGTLPAPMILADGSQAFTADQSLGSHKLTNVTDPTSAQDVATKNYVDAVATGLTPKPAAFCATVSALPGNVYNNGSSGVGATLTASANGTLTIDGTAPVVGNRILVKNEATAANNGLYVVSAPGSGSTKYILTRDTSMDTTAEVPGASVFVEQGTTNAATLWVCTDAAAIIGTTSITFTQFGGPGTYTAGTGLTLTGNQFSLTTAPVTAVTATGPLASSGGTTPAISLSNQSANTILAGPSSGSAAAPTFRAMVDADVPDQTITTISTNSTIGTSSFRQFLNTNGSSAAITLSSQSAGFWFDVRNSHTSSPLTINALSGHTLDGQSAIVIPPLTVVRITCLDGTNYASNVTAVGSQNASMVLSATQNVTTTFGAVSGMSLSLAPGTWLAVGAIRAAIQSSSGAPTMSCKLRNTTAGADIANSLFDVLTNLSGGATGSEQSAALTAIFTLGSTSTIQLWAGTNVATTLAEILTDTVGGSVVNFIRIA